MGLERAVKVLMICGPSGVGKGTLCKLLLDQYPNDFAFSISHTTRNLRPTEIDGRDYYKTSLGDMAAAISRGEFAEHANVHGQLYGTSFAELGRISREGKIALLDVDTHGVKSIKSSPHVESNCVGIVPPSLEELESRLRSRKSESEEQVQHRLHNAVQEIAFCRSDPRVDAFIVNENSWSVGFPSLIQLIHKWYNHTRDPTQHLSP